MTPWVKCFPYKHKDLCLDPQNPQRVGCGACVCNVSSPTETWEAEAGGSLEAWAPATLKWAARNQGEDDSQHLSLSLAQVHRELKQTNKERKTEFSRDWQTLSEQWRRNEFSERWIPTSSRTFYHTRNIKERMWLKTEVKFSLVREYTA